MNKYLFLDIDGVLNPTTNIHRHIENNNCTKSYNIILDPDCIYNLKQILLRTRCKIILCSNWKRSGKYSATIDNLLYQLNNNNIFIYSYTYNSSNRDKEKEIKEWLSHHKNTDYNYIILDDKLESDDLIIYKCNPYLGLNSIVSDHTINILNRVI